jgi:N-methylhydantoinase A/oxoprolinase/acetone carboxylase beta subunit
VVGSVPAQRPDLGMLTPVSSNGHASSSSAEARRVYSGGEWHEARVVGQDAVRAGLEIGGLAIVEMADTTIVIGDGQHAVVDQYGNVVITRGA